MNETWRQVNLKDFNEKEYFKCFKFYEPYNKDTKYLDFTHNGVSYYYSLIHLQDYDYRESINSFSYAVANTRLSEKELQELSPYCQCYVCKNKSNFLIELIKCICHLNCSRCAGCLKKDFYREQVIYDTRKYLESSNLKCI